MASPHKFQDEWIVKAALSVSGVTQAAIDELRRLGKTSVVQGLVDGGLLSAETLEIAVQDVHGVEFLEAKPAMVDQMALALVPERICRRHGVLPVEVRDETIVVIMTNPLDQEAAADIQAASGRILSPRWCFPYQLEEALSELFSPDRLINGIVTGLAETAAVEVLEGLKADADEEIAEIVRAPIIRLANSIIAKAVHMRASDIHIEHEERQSIVRYRIDGMLKNVMQLPRSIACLPLVSRIKIMSDLDLAERRKPQDGRAKLRVGSVEIGLRVSTLPTSFGEKVVMRILDKRAAEVPFDKLGFKPEIAAKIDALVKAAQGIFLVTGPTGSGKTTTLYSVLNRVKSEDTNIVTVEDPIEYKLAGINQVQVNEKTGLTFAAVLRSVLRQDPDIILLGEIRDRETADIAFQAALTGHLVLSTLHTNDSISTIARLSDIGVERFKIAPGLIAITAQRLVRRLCPSCKRKVRPEEADPLVTSMLQAADLPADYYEAPGCEECGQTGFKGRLSILELLEISPQLKEAIMAGAEAAEMRRLALNTDVLYTLSSDAAFHISQGDTTYAEVVPYLEAHEDREEEQAAPAPKAGAAAPPPRESAAPGPGETCSAIDSCPTPGPARVLLADDELANRFIIRKHLEGAGFLVDDAPDGLVTLEKISQKVPDLLLLDLKMPNLDGFGVLMAVRQTMALYSMPVIVITTAGDDKSQVDAFHAGADDYIIKPFKPQLLLARIKAALRRKDLL